MSTIKVDTIATRTGSGNITLSNSLASATVAGDLAVDTNVLKVDSTNNRVGIGVTSPGRKLELNNGGTGAFVTFTDGVATNFTFKTDGSNVGTFGTEAGSTHLALMASGTERMRIHSAGQVTTPNLPSFLTYGSPTMTDTTGNAGYFHNFTNTGQSFNNGSHYNNTTGRFTAPVAGKYMFGFSIARGESYSGGNQLIYIAKNSTSSGHYVGSNASASQANDQIQCHFIYNLAANDFVNATYYIGAGTFTRMATTPRNYFYGYLIG